MEPKVLAAAAEDDPIIMNTEAPVIESVPQVPFYAEDDSAG